MSSSSKKMTLEAGREFPHSDAELKLVNRASISYVALPLISI